MFKSFIIQIIVQYLYDVRVYINRKHVIWRQIIVNNNDNKNSFDRYTTTATIEIFVLRIEDFVRFNYFHDQTLLRIGQSLTDIGQ